MCRVHKPLASQFLSKGATAATRERAFKEGSKATLALALALASPRKVLTIIALETGRPRVYGDGRGVMAQP